MNGDPSSCYCSANWWFVWYCSLLNEYATRPMYSSNILLRRLHVVTSFIILTCEATVPRTYSLYPVGSSFVAASILCQLSMMHHALTQTHPFLLLSWYILRGASFFKLGTMTMCFVRIILHSKFDLLHPSWMQVFVSSFCANSSPISGQMLAHPWCLHVFFFVPYLKHTTPFWQHFCWCTFIMLLHLILICITILVRYDPCI